MPDRRSVARWKLITGIVVLSVIVLGLAYDLVALGMGGKEATVSRLCYYTCCRYPIVAFMFGVLCGHLFWPQLIEKEKK